MPSAIVPVSSQRPELLAICTMFARASVLELFVPDFCRGEMILNHFTTTKESQRFTLRAPAFHAAHDDLPAPELFFVGLACRHLQTSK